MQRLLLSLLVICILTPATVVGSIYEMSPPPPLVFQSPNANGPRYATVEVPISVAQFTGIESFSVHYRLQSNAVQFIEAVNVMPGLTINPIDPFTIELNFDDAATTLVNGTVIAVMRLELVGAPSSLTPTIMSLNGSISTNQGGIFQVTSNTGSIFIEPDDTPHTLQLPHARVAPGNSVTLPLTVLNFTLTTAVQFRLTWDTTVVSFESATTPANILDYTFFVEPVFEPGGPEQAGVLHISFEFDGDQTLPDNSELMSFQFFAHGNSGDQTPVNIEILGMGSEGVGISDHVATDGFIQLGWQLSGNVRYHNQVSMPGIIVIASGGNTLAVDSTDDNGVYSLFFNDPGNYLSITPSNNFDPRPMDGIDMGDVAAVMDYLAKPEASGFTPYQVISADVNFDQAVTIADAQIIQNMVLTSSNSLPTERQWTFTLEHHEFTDPSFVFDYPLNYSTLDAQNLPSPFGTDFAAMKLGDVDGNRDVAQANRITTRPVSMTASAYHLNDGKVRVELKANDFQDLRACQLTFSWDANEYSFISIDDTPGSRFGFPGDGYITMTWEGKSVPTEKILGSFTLAKINLNSNSSIRITGDVSPLKAFDSKYRQLEIMANSTTELEREMEVAVYPNPVQEDATLSLWVNKAQEAAVQVIDTESRIVGEFVVSLDRGFNRVVVSSSALPSGLYVVKVRLSDRISTIKLLKN